MSKLIQFLLIGFLLAMGSISCKKQDESSVRLAKFATELNKAQDRELNNGTILTGCEYEVGDTLFTYIIKVSDNRFDKLETDSIKRNFTKTVKSDGMSKIVKLLNNANIGLAYKLELPEKNVTVEFTNSELLEITGQNNTK